ncbi:hypothetical protein ABH004_15405 [Bacteroides ovatus]
MLHHTTSWVKLRECATEKNFITSIRISITKEVKPQSNDVKVNVEQMQKIVGNDAVVFSIGDLNLQWHKNNGYFLNPYYDWMKEARESVHHSTTAPIFNGFGYEGKKPGYLDYIFIVVTMSKPVIPRSLSI